MDLPKNNAFFLEKPYTKCSILKENAENKATISSILQLINEKTKQVSYFISYQW